MLLCFQNQQLFSILFQVSTVSFFHFEKIISILLATIADNCKKREEIARFFAIDSNRLCAQFHSLMDEWLNPKWKGMEINNVHPKRCAAYRIKHHWKLSMTHHRLNPRRLVIRHLFEIQIRRGRGSEKVFWLWSFVMIFVVECVKSFFYSTMFPWVTF